MAKKKAAPANLAGRRVAPSDRKQVPLQHRPRKKRKDDEETGEFSPTERDLQAYEMHCQGISADDISDAVGLSRRSVLARIRQTAEWWRGEKIGDIIEVRTQAVALLMLHYRQLKDLWDTARRVEQGKRSKNGDPIRLDRPIQIIKEMRNTLESMGKFLGVYVDPDERVGGDDGERVAGMSRSDVIRRTIERYEAMYERVVVIEKSTPNTPEPA